MRRCKGNGTSDRHQSCDRRESLFILTAERRSERPPPHAQTLRSFRPSRRILRSWRFDRSVLRDFVSSWTASRGKVKTRSRWCVKTLERVRVSPNRRFYRRGAAALSADSGQNAPSCGAIAAIQRRDEVENAHSLAEALDCSANRPCSDGRQAVLLERLADEAIVAVRQELQRLANAWESVGSDENVVTGLSEDDARRFSSYSRPARCSPRRTRRRA